MPKLKHLSASFSLHIFPLQFVLQIRPNLKLDRQIHALQNPIQAISVVTLTIKRNSTIWPVQLSVKICPKAPSPYSNCSPMLLTTCLINMIQIQNSYFRVFKLFHLLQVVCGRKPRESCQLSKKSNFAIFLKFKISITSGSAGTFLPNQRFWRFAGICTPSNVGRSWGISP